MTPEQLAKILGTTEAQHHDFKLEYDLADCNEAKQPGSPAEQPQKQNKKQRTTRTSDDAKDKLTKAVLGLANGNGMTDVDWAFLILGADDEMKNGRRKPKDMRGRFKDLDLFRIVNARCYPRLEFNYDEVALEGNTYGVVSIPPSPFLHWLKKPLFNDGNNGHWRTGVYPFRVSSEVNPATPEQLERAAAARSGWNQMPRISANAAVAAVAMSRTVAALLRAEARSASMDCKYRVGKPLEQMTARRTYRRWHEPDRTGGAPATDEVDKVRRADVMLELDPRRPVLIVGQPGFGKTIALLQEVALRASETAERIECDDLTWEDAGPVVFVHAHEVAKTLDAGSPRVAAGRGGSLDHARTPR